MLLLLVKRLIFLSFVLPLFYLEVVCGSAIHPLLLFLSFDLQCLLSIGRLSPSLIQILLVQLPPVPFRVNHLADSLLRGFPLLVLGVRWVLPDRGAQLQLVLHGLSVDLL